jgi:AcrR family transcriptional regulator
VTVAAIAAELEVSPGLVHFYCGDRQSLINAAWQEILMAHVADDLASINELAEKANWDGVKTLTDQIFDASRDEVHLAHLRASVDSQQDPPLSEIFDSATDVTTRYWEDQVAAGIALGTVATPLDLHALSILIMAVPIGVAAVKPRLTAEERAAVSAAWSTMLRAVLEPGFSMDAVLPTSHTENPGPPQAQSA